MPLYVVATPIGNPKDITLRALDVLKQATTIIGEERKPTTKLLKGLGLLPKKLQWLNEHTSLEEIGELVQICQRETVALVSDCGTPGFCDPGQQLVAHCRIKNIKVIPLPGASSLMALISVSGRPLKRFFFYGFLPQKSEERLSFYLELKSQTTPIVIMDTPYRYQKTINEIIEFLPSWSMTVGCDLTQSNEFVETAPVSQFKKIDEKEKREFVIILFPPKYKTNYKKDSKKPMLLAKK